METCGCETQTDKNKISSCGNKAIQEVGGRAGEVRFAMSVGSAIAGLRQVQTRRLGVREGGLGRFVFGA